MAVLKQDQLKAIVQRIVTALNPEAVYLYGSYGYGTPHAHSDIDLLVVVSQSNPPPHQQTVTAYRALRGIGLPVEVRVVTREDFLRRVRWVSSIERVVQEQGKLLYGRPIG